MRSQGARARRRAGLKDVARAAGVSVATVSYVLSGKRAVAEPTRQRVLAAVEELGYRRNLSAAALRDGHSSALALITPDVTNPFYTEILVGAEEMAARIGFSLWLRNAQLDADRERRYLADALASDCAAVLLAPFTPDTLAALDEDGGPHPPLVLIDEPVAGRSVMSVSVDNRAGGRLVAEHFAAIGRKRAAVLGAPEGMPTSVSRIESFVQRAAELGLSVPAIGTAHRRTGDAVDQALGMLDADPAIDCFFAGDDLLAVHLLRALARRGLRVPEDVAVCGFDDIPWASLVTPALTSVAQPARELGRRAVAAVPGLLEGEEPGDVVLPVELIARSSTMGGRPGS